MTNPSPLTEFLPHLGLRRQSIIDFEAWLADHTAWRTSPASTRYHLNHEGGLVEHSVNVTRTLLTLRDALAPDLSPESCVLVAMFHDLGKAGAPGQPYYLPNPSEWHVRKLNQRYVVNKELTHLDIATRSLFLVAQHVELADEEAQAIRFHDGQYIDENRSVAHRECVLTRLVQYADNWAGGVIEGEPASHVSQTA